MSVALAILTGVLMGLLHVYSGPDHLSAIAPIAADRRQDGWRVGLMWGLGHSSGVWVLTALVLLFRELIPIEMLSSWSERLVGLVLIGVGAWGVHRALQTRLPIAADAGASHAHTADGHHHKMPRGAAAIGMLHGLAGSSHLFTGALPILMADSLAARVGYAIGFGGGSIFAMVLFGALVGWAAQRSDRFGPIVFHRLLSFCSFAAIAVGCWWLVDGIRTAMI